MMDIPSNSKEADRCLTAQLRNDSEVVREMKVNLPFVLGKLRNLPSVGELSKHQLLRDKIIKSIKVLESISEWLEDPIRRKVSSDVISSLSKLTCRLNLIENEIDTFLVEKELPYRWGRKVLIKKKQILSSFTYLLDNFVLSVDSDQFIRVENFEPKTKKNLEEEEEEEASIPTSHDNMVEILKSSELGNEQHPRRSSMYVVANFKDAALIHGGECMKSGIQNDREMYLDEGVFNMSESEYFEESKNESDFVGHNKVKKKIYGRLLEVFEDNKRICENEVIAVTGPAMSGKTTLAKMIYDHSSIEKLFDLRLWYQYPVDFDVEAEDILYVILAQCRRRGQNFNRHSSVERMKRVLQTFIEEIKYCLIVIDDVRTHNDFNKLQLVLQCISVKKRVIITTRDKDLAFFASRWSEPLELQRLTEEESWTLFLEKLVIPVDRSEDPVLIQLKEKILRKCDGSPKAIVILAGLLSTRVLTDWSSVIEKELTEESILDLSYLDLPLSMKSCFLYLGLFPRAFQIPVRRLLHLWLAEGLVTPPLPDQNMASEDVAEKYLNELINRSMIEVAKLRSDGRPKTCRMPGFLWDLFFKRAVTKGVFHVHNTTDYTSAERPEFNVRRLAEYVGIKTYPSSDPYDIQHLHSYISFNTRKRDLPAQEIGTFLNTIVAKRSFGLLRVLDLEGVYKPILPEILKKFLHLKYLGLRWTFLDSLPLSTGTLPNLETLDVKHTNIITLPSSIWEAKNLRHLYMSEIHFDMSLQKPSGTGSLTNLRTLWGLYIGNKSLVYNCLNKLTALEKLGLTFNSTSKLAIAKWISQLTNLQSLRLRSSNEFGQPQELMLGNITEHQKLSDLYLLGQLRRGIRELQLPSNLKILTLSASNLEEDPMPMLGKLPQLNILRLFGNSFTGKQIACLGKGFPKLRVLKLWMLEELEEWIVENGTMPRLRELEIRCCFKLRQPQGLQHVTTLKDLTLTNMPEDFVTKVKTVMDKSVFIQENNWSFAQLQVRFLLILLVLSFILRHSKYFWNELHIPSIFF